MQNNPLFDVRDKVVLITGGAQGMGRMIAEGFLAAGAKTYVTSRSAAAAETAANEMRELGHCVGLAGDLSSADGTRALAEAMLAAEPVLDVLVNNAGKTWGAPFERFPDNAWPSVMAVNVQAPFSLTRDLAPALAAGGGADDPARVINIGSLAGATAEPLSAFSYSASKAAIHHLTRLLAAELAPRHITVNCIVPGYFPTKMTAHIRAETEGNDRLSGRIPLRRLGAPEDIAGACIFLSSRAGAYVTGVELCVDGGLSRC